MCRICKLIVKSLIYPRVVITKWENSTTNTAIKQRGEKWVGLSGAISNLYGVPLFFLSPFLWILWVNGLCVTPSVEWMHRYVAQQSNPESSTKKCQVAANPKCTKAESSLLARPGPRPPAPWPCPPVWTWVWEAVVLPAMTSLKHSLWHEKGHTGSWRSQNTQDPIGWVTPIPPRGEQRREQEVVPVDLSKSPLCPCLNQSSSCQINRMTLIIVAMVATG